MRLIVIGATSTIAAATARLLAHDGAELFLIARDGERLAAQQADLLARGASRVATHTLDANDFDGIEPALDAAWAALGAVDCALIAHGTLTDQARADADPAYTIREHSTNATSFVMIMTALCPRFVAQGHGTIAPIGSVAGDRGRARNYAYGAAKAAVATFAEGLAARLQGTGVGVLTIKPGLVATAMTAHLELPPLVTASPQRVARDIVAALARRRRGVLYTPWFWRWIMTAVRALPTPIFNRLTF